MPSPRIGHHQKTHWSRAIVFSASSSSVTRMVRSRCEGRPGPSNHDDRGDRGPVPRDGDGHKDATNAWRYPLQLVGPWSAMMTRRRSDQGNDRYGRQPRRPSLHGSPSAAFARASMRTDQEAQRPPEISPDRPRRLRFVGYRADLCHPLHHAVLRLPVQSKDLKNSDHMRQPKISWTRTHPDRTNSLF